MASMSIVVGVDGSEASRAALRWAAEEAQLRDADLKVIHAWLTRPLVVAGSPAGPEQWDALRRAADRLVHEVVAEELGDPLPPGTSVVAVHAPPAATLVEAAGEADLIVVGSRGLGGFRGLLLGSVSHEVVQHARCPVVVVRPTRVGPEHAKRRETAALAG